MRIALTGATGLLGGALMDSFVRAGHQVRAWVRSSCSLPRGVVALHGDLANPDTFPPLVRGVDALVHCAWQRQDPEDSAEKIPWVNLMGTLGLIEVAQSHGVGRILVFLDSRPDAGEFQPAPSEGWFRSTPQSPGTATQAAIEAYVHGLARREGWPVLAMALDSLYGTRRGRILPSYLEAMAKKSYHREEIRCLFNPGGYVHRRDIAAAVNLLLAQPAGTVEGRTFGCGDLWLDPYNLADLLDEIVGTLPECQVSIPPCRVDCSGLRRLGWSPGGQPLLRAELERWILETGHCRRPGDPRGPEPKPVQPSGGPTPP